MDQETLERIEQIEAAQRELDTKLDVLEQQRNELIRQWGTLARQDEEYAAYLDRHAASDRYDFTPLHIRAYYEHLDRYEALNERLSEAIRESEMSGKDQFTSVLREVSPELVRLEKKLCV